MSLAACSARSKLNFSASSTSRRGLRRKIKEVSVGGSLHYGIWARWMDVQACKLMQSFLEKADLKSEVKHFAHESKH